jgi:hypothetical protein
MRVIVALCCALAAATLGFGVQSAGASEPSGDPPAAMYSPATVDSIQLELPEASVKALEADPEGAYVEAEFSLATTAGTPETVGAYSAPIKVGVRLKGKIGSFRPLSQKAGFKIKFNAFVKGQKFLGLKKMTLNNMVQDQSMVHEVLAYEAFRAAGVPAPRAGFAYLEVNGEDFGLHLNIETTDEVAMEKRFGKFMHVYEGTYGSDVTPGGEGSFEIDEGDEEDISDLEGLVTLVNGSEPADFSTRVGSIADLAEMTRMWAVERYVGHWDGYTAANNYYLFSDQAGVFQMLPWGTDQTWGDHLPFEGGGGTLFVHCLEDPSCAALYRRALAQARQGVNDNLRFDELAESTAALLLPWQELEQGNARHESDLELIEWAVQETRDFIAARSGELGSWLVEHPVEPVSEVSVSLQPASILADGVSKTEATATVTDSYDNPAQGDQLEFTSSDPQTGFGPVVDHGDGTYTVEVSGSTTPGSQTITASDLSAGGSVSGVAQLVQTVGTVDHMTVELARSAIPADGATATTGTVKAYDSAGHLLIDPQVEVSSSDPGQVIGTPVGDGSGLSSFSIRASTLVGNAVITAKEASTGAQAIAVLTQAATLPQTEAGVTPARSGYFLPSTVITAHPKQRTRDRTPTFRFRSETSSAFRCRLGDRAYRPCDSPISLGRLSLGKHVFRVVAVDGNGQPGSAADYRFVVVPRKVAGHQRRS